MTDEEYRAAAREEYGREGEIEIDDAAEVSRADEVGGDDGAYVQAWVWVANEGDSTPQHPAQGGSRAAGPMFPAEGVAE